MGRMQCEAGTAGTPFSLELGADDEGAMLS